MQPEPTILSTMNSFFNRIYNEGPNVCEESDRTIYSCSRWQGAKKISVIINRNSECHIDIEEIPYQSDWYCVQIAIDQLFKYIKQSKACDLVCVHLPCVNIPTLGKLIPESFTIADPDKGGLVVDKEQNKFRIYQWVNQDKKYPGTITAQALILDMAARK